MADEKKEHTAQSLASKIAKALLKGNPTPRHMGKRKSSSKQKPTKNQTRQDANPMSVLSIQEHPGPKQIKTQIEAIIPVVQASNLR